MGDKTSQKEKWGEVTNYAPTESDLRWCRELVDLLKDGGIWGCDWGIYRIYKKDKKLEMETVNPLMAAGEFAENHARTVKAFGMIGWEVSISKEVWKQRGEKDVNEEAF